MSILDIQPRRHNSGFTAGDRVVTPDGHAIVIATYVVKVWVLPDGKRNFVSYTRDQLKRED